jgi:hypothetical protein
MNQPMSFVWNTEAASLAKKAGATGGISETGAYEGFITSAIYTFGKDGSQSQALELSLTVTVPKPTTCASTTSGKMDSKLLAWG